MNVVGLKPVLSAIFATSPFNGTAPAI
jgi:hypothetical protein